MDDGVRINLNTNQVTSGAAVVRLTQQQAEILETIHRGSPHAVHVDRIAGAVYGQRYEPENEKVVIRTQISHIRRLTKDLPFTIETIGQAGYRYVPKKPNTSEATA